MSRLRLLGAAVPVLALLAYSPSAWCQVTGLFYASSEPANGFHGLTWGVTSDSISDLRYVKTDPSWGGLKIYTRKEQPPAADRYKEVHYYFWKDMFHSAEVLVEGKENCAWLLDQIRRFDPLLLEEVSPIRGLEVQVKGRKHYHIMAGLDVYVREDETFELRVAIMDDRKGVDPRQISVNVRSLVVQRQIDQDPSWSRDRSIRLRRRRS